jgi:hypothetical protein
MEGVTTKEEATNTQAGEIRRARSRVSLETIGETVLVVLVGAFFVYLFIESLNWPLGSALMPWIAVGIGAPFWVYRLLALLSRVRQPPSQIMDIGFRTGGDAAGERARFLRITLFILGLYLGIWLFGFHVALPLGILFYIRVYGRLSWLASLCVGLLFLSLLVGVYDRLLNANWHKPLALQWFESLL